LPAASSASRFPTRPSGSTFCAVPRSLARSGSSSRFLFEGSSSRCGFPRPVAGPWVTSHEVDSSSEFYERRPCRLIWLPAASSASRFPTRPSGSTFCAVPRSLARSGSSSRERCLPFRVRTASSLPHARMREAPSLRFCSPSRHQQQRSTCERGPTLTLRSVLGVSHALDGFRPLLPGGLVSSHSHVRDSPSRGLFPPPSCTVSSTVAALLSLSIGSCRELPRDVSSGGLAFRALFRVAIRGGRRGS
jgi:hypothetical protein